MADPVERIRSLRDNGRFMEATRNAEQYLWLDPTDAARHAELGQVYLHAAQPEQAVASLRQAIVLAPKEASYHYQLALTLEQLGRDGEAIAGLRQAVVLAPEHVPALERLGNFLLTYGRRPEAADCFRRAAAGAPDSLTGRVNRAKVLLEEDDSAAAEALLLETSELHPASLETKRFLARIMREQGRFAEAIPLLEAATEGTPGQAATAYYDLAMCKRIGADDQPMLEQMRALLALKEFPEIHRPRLHYGLGKALDDLGDYQDAMRHFDEANRIIHRSQPFDRARFAVGVDRTIRNFTAEFFAAHAAAVSTSETPVLIVGMPRSGTTLLEQILSSHPDVGGAGELTFWNDQAEAVARNSIQRFSQDYTDGVAADYEAVLRRFAPDASRITDKMPGNFLWIGLIHLVFPRARIIHSRRHPVDTCLSNYFTSFGESMPYANNKADLVFYYRQYERLMQHWRETLPAESFLDVDYEQLVADNERMTRRLIDFIGLDWSDACLRPQDNTRVVKTASMWQARQPIYRSSTERWRRYEPWLGDLNQLLQPAPAQSVIRRSPEVLSLLQRAVELRQAGKLGDVVPVLLKAAQLSPDDPWIENEGGLNYLARHAWPAAINSFERSLALDPGFALAWYNLGFARERVRDGDGAIAAYQQAIERSPALVEAHSRLGNILHARGRREEARACFRQAADSAPNATLGRLNAVKLLLDDEKPGEAESLLRQIVADDPASSEAWRLLGNGLRETGRFGEAIECLEQAIAREPRQVAAYHDLVQAKRITAADRPLIGRMQMRLRGADLTDFDRTLLHFALGKAFDDQGAWQEAMAHFDAGNRLEHTAMTFNRAAFAAGIDRLIAQFSPELLAAARQTGSASELPVLILGMPRSGTTLVEQVISSHPGVAAGGELHFWNDHAADAVQRLTPDALGAQAADYLATLRRIGAAALRVTDKMPFNFLWAGLIHAALPGARIVHCRRDPIDTCLSIYFTRFATRQDFAYDRGDLAFYYAQYERLMAHWRTVLPAERFLEVDYEDLVADAAPQARRMIEFCGLDWDDACLRPEDNRRVVRTASMWQARQPVYRTSVERWRNYEPWLGELATLKHGDR